MVWRITPSNLLVDDPDAITYLAAVEAADGQALESGVRLAVNAFIKGCKADGIWPAIKASCILAGARTLAGALVPLVGTAPTNNNFVSGDYNRKTGLQGNGSTKFINSNRANNTEPQNNQSQCVYATAPNSTGSPAIYMGVGALTNPGTTHFGQNPTVPNLFFRNRNATAFNFIGENNATGLIGFTRNSSSFFVAIANRLPRQSTTTSNIPATENIYVFGRSSAGALELPTNACLAFYSIGESLDLALLDARVTTLINAIAAAIP